GEPFPDRLAEDAFRARDEDAHESPLQHVHQAGIADHEAIRGRLELRALDPHLLADQARFDPHRDILDGSSLENDRMLDLAVSNRDLVVDRREGADVGVLDDTALADDERAAEDRMLNGGARAVA